MFQKIKILLRNIRNITIISLLLAGLILLMTEHQPRTVQAGAQVAGSSRRVNVPYLTGNDFTPAIFWLGKVDPYSNYADIRLGYYDEALVIYFHIIDRRLWIDNAQNPSQIALWDAASIYMDLDGNIGSSPGIHSYRFETELSNNLQASYRGNGTTWVAGSFPFISDTSWRGAEGPNSNADSEGWIAHFEIPYTSLGLSGPPPQGTQWGLGVIVHDRDDAEGTIREDTSWPETMDRVIPSTWGQLSFGLENFFRPRVLPVDSVMIRQGLNGASVVDGEVGGHTTCGNDGYNKWTDWGNANYAGGTQNQHSKPMGCC